MACSLVWKDVRVFVREEAFQSHLLDPLVLMTEQLRQRREKKTVKVEHVIPVPRHGTSLHKKSS